MMYSTDTKASSLLDETDVYRVARFAAAAVAAVAAADI